MSASPHVDLADQYAADVIRDHDVQEVVFDPAHANWMMGQLMERRVAVYEFNIQSRPISEPMKEVAALIDAGKLLHGDAPNGPMSWQMSNVVNRPNATDEDYPRKERPELKIDNPVALMMAMARAMANVNTKSVYEQRGLLVFG